MSKNGVPRIEITLRDGGKATGVDIAVDPFPASGTLAEMSEWDAKAFELLKLGLAILHNKDRGRAFSDMLVASARTFS